jgi:glycosyltransferase involved in cell wall biosynthesis
LGDQPFFSVIVPTYDQDQYLSDALDSLIAQTYTNWEAVIVNDGSLDETPEALQEYAQKDSRFRIFDKPNSGVASALNLGLSQARGTWLCWLSSDDLFDERKLEVHREWIAKNPDCRFFFSHYKELDDSTGRITDPPSWGNPDRELQVIEALRTVHIRGSSVCVNRGALTAVGHVDETLLYGQGYDMWLRLLVMYPAVMIPISTCISRLHPQQDRRLLFKAVAYDSAKAAIKLLNRHSFPELFPAADLRDPTVAYRLTEKALEVAADSRALMYSLGAHPGLLLRILEWIWGDNVPFNRVALQRLVWPRAAQVSTLNRGTTFGHIWRAVALATSIHGVRFTYTAIPHTDVARIHYQQLVAKEKSEAQALMRYLKEFGHLSFQQENPVSSGLSREIVIVPPDGTDLATPLIYGALRATLEIAKSLAAGDDRVLFVCISTKGMGLLEGLLYVGAPDESSFQQMIAGLEAVDVLIGMSRTDVLALTPAKRVVVYHHDFGPVSRGGLTSSDINFAGLPIVCVSESQRNEQVGLGIARELLYVVPNAYDPTVFRGSGNETRHLHSLVFAGTVTHYKGVDIALKAFKKVKCEFPDAIFHVYGHTYSWGGIDNLLNAAWINEKGCPDWDAITNYFPGVRYHGEVGQTVLAKAFRENSLLVIPSKVNETFGLVSLEAQACGCIPVLPRRGGFPETVLEGKTGYLYDDNTPEGLAATIASLWRRGLPTDDQRLSAQKWVQAKFSWDKSARLFQGVLAAEPIRRDVQAVLTARSSSVTYPQGHFMNRVLQNFLANLGRVSPRLPVLARTVGRPVKLAIREALRRLQEAICGLQQRQ